MTAISRARAGKKSEGGEAPFSWWLHLPPPLSGFFSRLDIQSGRKMDSHLKKIHPLFFLGAKIPFLPWGRKKTLLREKGVFVSNRKSHFVSGAFELFFFIKYLFSSIEVIAGVRLLALFPQMVPLVRAQGKLLHEIQTPFSNKN